MNSLNPNKTGCTGPYIMIVSLIWLQWGSSFSSMQWIFILVIAPGQVISSKYILHNVQFVNPATRSGTGLTQQMRLPSVYQKIEPLIRFLLSYKKVDCLMQQLEGWTWNLSRMHAYYPCKIYFHWGKIFLWTYAVCCKFTSCCFVVLIFNTFGWLRRNWG